MSDRAKLIVAVFVIIVFAALVSVKKKEAAPDHEQVIILHSRSESGETKSDTVTIRNGIVVEN